MFLPLRDATVFLPLLMLGLELPLWKNWPELAVKVVFRPCLIETCLLPTEGFEVMPPLPRLSDFLLTGILAAAGTYTSFIEEGIWRGMFRQGCIGLLDRL